MYPTIITNSLEINTTYISSLLFKSLSGELDTENISSDPEKFNDQIQIWIFDKLMELWLVSYMNIEDTMVLQIDSRFNLI
jgi:hypothetical protein